MRKPALTDKDKAYIRKNRLKMSSKAMAKHIGCSPFPVQRFIKKEGLQPPPEVIKEFRRQAMIGKTTLTPKQDEIIKANYLDIPIKQLARKVGKSQTAIRCRLRQLGLIIPDEIIQKRKCNSRFKKGHAPMNKGKKQEEYMSAEAIEKTKATRFKKGHIPHQAYDSDGVITIRSGHPHRGGKPYKWIRIALGNWKQLHVHNWEKENGPVPKGMIVIFKNGDTMNCDLSNLELISRAENARRNIKGYYSYPTVLKKAMKLNKNLIKTLKENEQSQ